MDSGPACACAERGKSPEDREWVVLLRGCTYNIRRNRKDPSIYSSVQCLICGRVWNTRFLNVDPYRDPRGPIRWVQLNRKEGRWTDAPRGEDVS
jgi:hypothetical protein